MKEKITATIGKFIDDMTTLDVLTLSGTIALKPEPKPLDGAAGAGGGAKEMKWDDYFKSIVEKLKTPDDSTRLEIVAYTHTEIDADSVNFYRTAGTEDALRDLHIRTVEAATKARLEAVAAFARVFK